MIAYRFDPGQRRSIARPDIEEMLVPIEVFSPVEALDAIDRGISLLVVTGFVPRLKTQRGDAKLRPGKGLGRSKQVHACGVEPDAGTLFVRRGIEHGHLANPRAAQGESVRATGLSAADDRHVMIDPGAIRNPVR